MKIAFGTKMNMGRHFRPDGSVVAYTAVQILSACVTRIRTMEKDGYHAVQVAVGHGKLAPSVKGQLKAAGIQGARYLAEIRMNESMPVSVGSHIDYVASLMPGTTVNVIGTSKGRGYQGVVKRHGFRGHPTTHGHKDQTRMPGSIGAGGVQHVFKGMRMAGHMGDSQVTVKNLEIIAFDSETQTVHIAGAIPGARGSQIIISSSSFKPVFVSTTKAEAGTETSNENGSNETVRAPVSVESTT